MELREPLCEGSCEETTTTLLGTLAVACPAAAKQLLSNGLTTQQGTGSARSLPEPNFFHSFRGLS